MDAVEYEKVRFRMCRTHILEKGDCEGCKAYRILRRRCGFVVDMVTDEVGDKNAIEKNIAIVEQWAKDNPTKTRQSEFLKQFPNADMQRINTLFPCVMDQTVRTARCIKYKGVGCPRKCVECRNDYWNEEITDND